MVRFGAVIIGLTGSALLLSSPVSAETFSIDGSNKALNTNNNFSKIDGNPRLSIWDSNPNDADQQFDRIAGTRGGTLLKQRSTGKCINVHYLYNGGLVNVWTCNPADPDQNLNITSVGGGYSQIQRTGTNLCIDSPTRDNGGKTHVWQCVNNTNQRFRNSGTTIPNPPQPPSNNGGLYYRNFEGFINFAVGQVGIARLDTSNYKGQCVTLIARYIQEVYLTGSDRTKSITLNNGFGTANAVASQFSQFFSPVTNQGLPKRGAVVSFPDIGYVKDSIKDGCPNNYCGHTAIVMESKQLPNGQRQIRIMDSNGNGLAPNTSVKEYYSSWINIPNGTANGYGNNIYWTNPK